MFIRETKLHCSPPLPRPSHFFISRLIAAFKSLTQILLCPALRSYPALAVVSGVDPRGKVLAARRAIRGLLPGVLCCAQGDKRGEGRGRAPGRSEPPAFPDPQPSPAPADSGTLGLAPGAVGGADLAWPRVARWHSKATPGHGEGCRGESLLRAEFHSPRRLPALLGEKTVTPALLRCRAGSGESQRSSCKMPLIFFFPPLTS